MSDFCKSETNKIEYDEKLAELKARYSEKLKSVLNDAREKFRFSLSALLIGALKECGGECDVAELAKSKSQIIEMERKSVILILRREIGTILTEYAKELIVLSSAFCEKPDLKNASSFLIDDTRKSLRNEKLLCAKKTADGLKNDEHALKEVFVFCPNSSVEKN